MLRYHNKQYLLFTLETVSIMHVAIHPHPTLKTPTPPPSKKKIQIVFSIDSDLTYPKLSKNIHSLSTTRTGIFISSAAHIHKKVKRTHQAYLNGS